MHTFAPDGPDEDGGGVIVSRHAAQRAAEQAEKKFRADRRFKGTTRVVKVPT